jgi:tryptophanyl-tRNA synthetase
MILGEATRVMSLRDGSAKMSKSEESDYSRINLTDDAETIALKVRKAKSDADALPSEPAGLEGRAEAKNLVTIFAALARKTKAEVLTEYGGKGFAEFKRDLADLAVSSLSPITRRMSDLMAAPDEIDRILAKGAEKARATAAPVMDEVMKTVGFWRG